MNTKYNKTISTRNKTKTFILISISRLTKTHNFDITGIYEMLESPQTVLSIKNNTSQIELDYTVKTRIHLLR